MRWGEVGAGTVSHAMEQKEIEASLYSTEWETSSIYL